MELHMADFLELNGKGKANFTQDHLLFLHFCGSIMQAQKITLKFTQLAEFSQEYCRRVQVSPTLL